MGFFKKIVKSVESQVKSAGDTLWNSTKNSLKNSLINAAYNSSKNVSYGNNGNTGRVSQEDILKGKDYSFFMMQSKDSEGDQTNTIDVNLWANPKFNGGEGTYTKILKKYANENLRYQSYINHNYDNITAVSTTEPSKEYNMNSSMYVPRWGYKDFINERMSFQKSLDSLTGEPGWFYFKIFFKFDTNFGLLGGILSDEYSSSIMASQNTAINYLTMISKSYKTINAKSRIIALRKFVQILSWINTNAPWFFKKVSNVSESTAINFDELTKEKSITIDCSEDAVDMRLTNLLDLYRYVCYDNVYQRVIVPENLRKFDMSIVLFHTPIRNYHTAFTTLSNGTYGYKSLVTDDNNDFSDVMSFKIINFIGCEFDENSMTTMPSELNNENAFSLDNAHIKIKYDRAYVGENNEWFEYMFNDVDGFIYPYTTNSDTADEQKSETYSVTNNWGNRLKAIKYYLDHKYFYDPKGLTYKSLVEASEGIITDAMRTIDPKYAFGN